MKCPNCQEVLVMADRQGVEIDYCPTCRGVWLDKGELDKIIEKSNAYYPDKSDNYKDEYREQPKRGGYDDEYYKKKKRRGFLGDMFDFD